MPDDELETSEEKVPREPSRLDVRRAEELGPQLNVTLEYLRQ